MVRSIPKLHRRARFALDSLPPEEQKLVLDRLEQLGRIPVPQWLEHGFRKIPGEEPLYLLSIDPDVRAIFRITPDAQPEVLDIVRHETLKVFATNGQSPGQQ